MKKLHFILLLFVLIGLTLPSFAQTHTIEEVSGIRTNSIGTLKEGNEIVGYYMFFLKDALDKKTNLFELNILDANLEEIYVKEMELPVKTMLQEVAYNNKTICLKLYDSDRSDKAINSRSFVIFKQFDISGNLVSNKKKELNARSSSIYTDPSYSEHFNLKTLDDKGYLAIFDVKHKKRGYEVLYIPSSPEEKSWTFGSKKESNLIEGCIFLSFQNDIAFFLVYKSKKLLTTKFESYIVAFDISSRKLLFETPLEESVVVFVIDKTYIDPISGETILISQYYNKEKPIAGGVRGIMITKINNSGEVVNQKLFPWENSFAEYFLMNEKGKKENDKTKLYFHDINIAKNGDLFLLTEEFKKSTSGKSVAKGLLTMGAGGGTNLTFSDMHLLQFSKDLELMDVKRIEKKKTNFELPLLTGMYSSRILMNLVKFAGTDYLFSIKSNDHNTFSLVYIDREGTIGNLFERSLSTASLSESERQKTGLKRSYHYNTLSEKFKNDVGLKILTYKNGEYIEDSIPLNDKNCGISIYPAPSGKLMISRHYFDSKKLELSMIKINN